MALDTISISDIGKSLLEIESEIIANNSSISYYKKLIADYHDKNDALTSLARSLLLNALPNTVMTSERSPI